MEANNYTDNGAHNMTAEERREGVEGFIPDFREDLPHAFTNHSSNRRRWGV